MPSTRFHRDPSRILIRLLVVLAVTLGALLTTVLPASAAGKCIDVYEGPYGTTVCTP
jgi:hypothetical protein